VALRRHTYPEMEGCSVGLPDPGRVEGGGRVVGAVLIRAFVGGVDQGEVGKSLRELPTSRFARDHAPQQNPICRRSGSACVLPQRRG
jgi:hypothetical protein